MKFWGMPESMRLASVWVAWAFLSIGILGWALFTVLDYFDSKGDAAAWVQAVGSIVAIFVAIAIADHQRRVEADARQRDALAEEVGRATALYFAVWEVSKSVERLTPGLERGDVVTPSLPFMYEQMLGRYGQSFNGDLDRTRIKIATRLRYDLTVLVVALKDEQLLGREHVIKHFKKGTEHFAELLGLATAHLDKVKETAGVVDN